MKAVLISIQPKWCYLIANGKKTIELRKSKPKLETPFKCYIYCTKPSKKYQTICGCMVINTDELYRLPNGEIKHDWSGELMCCNGEYTRDNFLHGKVIGEFVCDDIDTVHVFSDILYCVKNSQANKLGQMCLTIEEVKAYLGENDGYDWHITDLKIYDKPKELGEFFTKCNIPESKCKLCDNCYDREDYYGRHYAVKKLTRPPQSWRYVEE